MKGRTGLERRGLVCGDLGYNFAKGRADRRNAGIVMSTLTKGSSRSYGRLGRSERSLRAISWQDTGLLSFAVCPVPPRKARKVANQMGAEEG